MCADVSGIWAISENGFCLIKLGSIWEMKLKATIKTNNFKNMSWQKTKTKTSNARSESTGIVEADVNCQEEEEEEEEAVWLREAGPPKNDISRGFGGGGGVVPVIRSKAPPSVTEATGKKKGGGGCHGGKRGWHGSLGRSEEGAGVGSPEGCYHHSEKAPGLRGSA